jgi:hypothetical protein
VSDMIKPRDQLVVHALRQLAERVRAGSRQRDLDEHQARQALKAAGLCVALELPARPGKAVRP